MINGVTAERSQSVFLEDVLFTEVVAMIAPEYYDRIGRVLAVVQSI